jgi:hypothetical protein
MEKLAKAIKLAAKIHEESFASGQVSWGEVVVSGAYKKTILEAADEASEEVGFDTRGTLPVFLLLQHCWNDILDWANQFDRNEDIVNEDILIKEIVEEASLVWEEVGQTAKDIMENAGFDFKIYHTFFPNEKIGDTVDIVVGAKTWEGDDSEIEVDSFLKSNDLWEKNRSILPERDGDRFETGGGYGHPYLPLYVFDDEDIFKMAVIVIKEHWKIPGMIENQDFSIKLTESLRKILL